MRTPDYARVSSVVRAADTERLAGGSIELLAETAGMASNRAVLRAGSAGVPPHFHAQSSEVFLVLAGSLEALVDEEVLTLSRATY